MSHYSWMLELDSECNLSVSRKVDISRNHEEEEASNPSRVLHYLRRLTKLQELDLSYNNLVCRPKLFRLLLRLR